VSGWKNEDDIKAELRTLTQELRKLREELRGMVSHPHKPDPGRAIRLQSWPPSPGEPVATAADATRKRPKNREDEKK